jgi:hypothetical protein
MAYKVFISYATKDLLIVNHVARLLKDASIEVYIAEYSALPGTDLDEDIIAAIESCDLFILLWSQNSKASEWVPQEIGIARHAKKTIIPVVLEANLNLPGFIKKLKYLPAYKNPVNQMTWLRTHVFEHARKKQQTDGLTWLGIGAAFIWLLSRDDE